ncbi:MAG TPA: ATP-grasp domain-containing protein [Gemmatimonadales bacterium]
MTRVLIAGVSTRGFAESAARAGYDVVAVDGFGDLDLRARAQAVALARQRTGRFSTAAAVRAATGLRCDAVCYVASFENHPRAVAALAAEGGGELWGNPPEVLARVRDPARVARALAARGFATPLVRRAPPVGGSQTAWLVKPRASGGGSGIAPWSGHVARRVPRGHYLQQRIAGLPGSIVFAAEGRRAVPLGLSLALVGERAFGGGGGGAGFRYCGNILFAAEPQLRAVASRLAAAVTEEFGLVGVNGIDFVASGGIPYPVEINPRYTASLELVERAYGLSIFETHARACAGTLPAFDLAAAFRTPGAVGKAIVYARRDVTAPDTRAWLEDDSVRDVPVPGAGIARGRPICTIFARGEDAAACRRALVARARAVYHAVEERRARIA